MIRLPGVSACSRLITAGQDEGRELAGCNQEALKTNNFALVRTGQKSDRTSCVLVMHRLSVALTVLVVINWTKSAPGRPWISFFCDGAAKRQRKEEAFSFYVDRRVKISLSNQSSHVLFIFLRLLMDSLCVFFSSFSLVMSPYAPFLSSHVSFLF